MASNPSSSYSGKPRTDSLVSDFPDRSATATPPNNNGGAASRVWGVDEAMKRNQESMFAEEQAARQEQEENVEGHQSRVEETYPFQRREVSEIREMWKEIRMLRQQSNVGEYDGNTNPEVHLGRFENAALLHQYSDRVRCRVFLGTLVRSAQQWFNSLQPNSIRSFEDFSAAFLHRFASSKRHQKNYLSMFVMKQQENETLREFVQRFNSEALEIPAATIDIMISAFTQGLRGGEFFKSLVKKPPSSYDDLLVRAEKYVNLEDAQRSRDEVREPAGRWEKSRRVECSARFPSQDRREGSASESRPRSRSSPRRGQGPPWINQGVGEQRGEGRGQDVPQELVEPRRRTNEDNHPTRGIIHMISDSATDRDSGRARKAHGMVTATISNYDVARIFIDNGSSVNILFKSTLDQMKMEGFEFEPVSTPLFGFAGHAIPPLGQIVLPLSLGTDHPRVTKMIAFTVVDTPSAYNAIL
ncbi:uncharacterized protein [Primulina eburnea]|uniref:uncharacterized protein n=1 Tax=Primulina eburnea TaxID=1245227 RepID=UPI003C6BF4DD